MQTGVLVVLIYLRVSTEEQAKKGYSLPEQRRSCYAKAEQIAREHGLQLRVVEFEDHDPGEVLNRPVLNEVREFIRTGQVHVFICLDPDRFARSLYLQLLVTEEIEKRRIRLEFVQHRYERTDEGRLFYQVRGAVSEFEKAKIKERMRRGKLGALRDGRIPHRMDVFGYEQVKGTGKLEVHSAQAAWVQQMYRWVVEEHLTPIQVAERMNGMGVPAPRGRWWYRKTVYNILRNPIYTGRLLLNRQDWSGVKFNRFRSRDEIVRPEPKPEEERIEVQVPEIIPQEMWDAAQRILGTARRRKGDRPKHLLSGLCRCGLCHGPVHYLTSRNRVGKTYRWLRCVNRDPRMQALDPARRPVDRCLLPHVRADEVDAWVKEQVYSWFEDPESLRRKLEQAAAGEDAGPSASSSETELELLRAQHRQLDVQQDRLLDALQDPNTPAEKIRARLADLSQQMAALRARIAALTQQAQTGKPAVDSIIATLERVRQEVRTRLDDLTAEGWQHLIRSLGIRVIIKGPTREDWDIDF